MKLQSPEFNLTSLLSHITVLLTLICILRLVCPIYQLHGINMGDLPVILELILVIIVLGLFFLVLYSFWPTARNLWYYFFDRTLFIC